MIAQQTIETAAKVLAERFRPSRIILFGSQARGTADSRSDVDMLVITRVRGKRREMMTKMDSALEQFDCPFDILILTSKEFEQDKHIPGTVARYASREGRVLYERK